MSTYKPRTWFRFRRTGAWFARTRPTSIYKNEVAKFEMPSRDDIAERHAKGQPVLDRYDQR
jgi:hypothetical protein